VPTRIKEEEKVKYIKDNYPRKSLLKISEDIGVSKRAVRSKVKELGLDVCKAGYKVEEYDDPNYKEHLEWIMERPNTKLSSMQAKEIGNSEYYVRVVKKYNRKNYKTR